MRSSLAALALAHVAADASVCVKPDGSKAPCGPGNQECSQFGFGADMPQFHVRDNSCGENDPNGPVYDPVHGVYHLHYQNHVGLTRPDGSGGRTYGHAISRDFVHWAHMPISIWNDRPYDSRAIFTGSATVVDGKVIQVYPGLCDTDSDDCPAGTNLCIAVPADPMDPLQTNWTKEAWVSNPVVAGIGRDPSTAWQTPDGEWRLTTFDTMIFGSMDFKTWYRIGTHPDFIRGECPSFFELPRTTPGAGPPPAGVQVPTHVHKASHGGKDWMNVGTYIPGKPNVLDNFTATPGVPHQEQLIDAGHSYASKDFYDPVKKRRINWGWAKVRPQVQTLPREVTWHPELQQLVFSPVAEQDQLRQDVVASLQENMLPAASEVYLGLPSDAGNQSEVLVSFKRPDVATRFVVRVMADHEPASLRTEMSGWNLGGGDYNVTNVNYTDFKICEQACDHDSKCKAWTYVVRGPLYASCCLKSKVRKAKPSETCTSGVKNGKMKGATQFFIDYVPPPKGQSISKATVGILGEGTSTLKLLATDATLDMRLFVDQTLTEVYWMGGRVAMTANTPGIAAADVTVMADSNGAALASAKAWKVGSIWVTPEEILATPSQVAALIV